MISNIKKNKVGSKGCHIVTGTAAISFSHGVITRERHKKATLATHLSKLSRKKICYISTTYKIVKILTSHFCIIRHYIYIRGTTYVSYIRFYNLMIYITKYKNVSIYVSSSLSYSPYNHDEPFRLSLTKLDVVMPMWGLFIKVQKNYDYPSYKVQRDNR